MIKFHTYITDLLCIYDCVIIPGLGGFITNYKSSEHKELNHTFYPPSKDILFNANLTYNDGLLISTIAKNKNITYYEAEQYVDNKVQNIWLDLENNKAVEIKNIGSFKLKNNKIIFTQKTENNLLSESFGLSVFRFPPLNYKSNNHSLSTNYNNSNMNSKLKNSLKWAAVLIPFVAILSLIPYVNNNNEQTASFNFWSKTKSLNEPIEKLHSATIKEEKDNDNVVVNLMDKTTDKKTALFYNEENKELKKRTIQKQTLNKTYYIIGASYKAKNKAIEESKIFIKKGFSSAEVIESDDLFRVSIYKDTDKLTALHKLIIIRNKTNNNSFWLLSK